MTKMQTVKHPRAPYAVALLVTGALAACGAAVAQDNGADYYKLVTEQNVFRKLGWSKPDETPRYSVVLIALAPEPEPEPEPEAAAEADFWAGILGAPSEPVEETPAEEAEEPAEPRKHRALITRNGSNEVFYVEVGEKVQELTVRSIEQGKVTLAGDGGDETEITLDTGRGGFGGGGGGGGGRRSGPGPRASGPPGGGREGGRRFGRMPGNAREMMERFRNASPEERQQMRAQFRGGRGGGRGRRGD